MTARQGKGRESQSTSQGRKPKRAGAGDFTIEQKVTAVTAALTANREHPEGRQALAAAQAACGQPIHISTLDDWLHKYRAQVEATLIVTPIEETILATRDKTLSNMLKAKDIAMKQLLNEEKANAASYRDSGVVMGILHDKIESSIGLSPSMVATVQAWERICNALGLPAEELIKANTEKLQALQQARLNQTTLSTGDE